MACEPTHALCGALRLTQELALGQGMLSTRSVHRDKEMTSFHRRSVMRPFFKRFGSKWLLSRYLPPPRYPRIIEPFAGSAGYSTRYGAYRDVLLIDADPLVVAAWEWLIHASPDEIRALPGRTYFQNQRHYQEQWPMGLNVIVQSWSGRAGKPIRRVASQKTMTSNSTWREAIRERLARQVTAIRSWRVIHGDWSIAPTDAPATWVIDPPYEGNRYTKSAYRHQAIDYRALREWIGTLRGQIIVHEMATASWFPMRTFRTTKTLTNHLIREGLFYWDTELQGPVDIERAKEDCPLTKDHFLLDRRG